VSGVIIIFVLKYRKFLTMGKKSVKLYTDNVLDEFYKHVLDGNIEDLHIPHSDVFYVREAVQAHYGRPFTLEHVEWAMRMEGWTDGDS
tara:strand:+ start:96 stop:359 length:264 start_codon:yes stop_codon:yes gene_type:complete